MIEEAPKVISVLRVCSVKTGPQRKAGRDQKRKRFRAHLDDLALDLGALERASERVEDSPKSELTYFARQFPGHCSR